MPLNLAAPLITAAIKAFTSHKGGEREAAKHELKEEAKRTLKDKTTVGALLAAGGSSQVPADTLEGALTQIALGLVGLILLFIRSRD